MSLLAQMALGAGVLLVAAGLPLVGCSARVKAALEAFPRSKALGWTLAALALAWSAWLLHETPLGRFEGAKAYLPVLAPVAFVAVAVFMDELLAARALGGLLALAPSPMLEAARWHPSPLRLAFVGLAYLMAMAGIVLILSPYRFRRTVAWLLRSDRTRRVAGAVLIGAGVGVAVLGLAVY